MGGHVEVAEVAPDGSRLAVGALSGRAVLLPIAAGAAPLDLPGHEGGVARLRFAPAGGRLAVAGHDGRVRVLTHGGEVIGEATSRGRCRDLAWSGDGALLVASFGREVVGLGADGRERWRAVPTSGPIGAVAPIGAGAVALGGRGAVELVSPDGAVSAGFGWPGAVLVLATSPDGRWLAGGNQDASVRVRTTGAPPDDLVMTGFAGKVEVLAWSPDSRRLAVANLGEVTVWDFAGRGPKGTMPRRLTGHRGRVTAVAPHPALDGVVMTADESGLVRVWRDEEVVGEELLGAAVGCATWLPDRRSGLVGSSAAVGLGDGRMVRCEVVADG